MRAFKPEEAEQFADITHEMVRQGKISLVCLLGNTSFSILDLLPFLKWCEILVSISGFLLKLFFMLYTLDHSKRKLLRYYFVFLWFILHSSLLLQTVLPISGKVVEMFWLLPRKRGEIHLPIRKNSVLLSYLLFFSNLRPPNIQSEYALSWSYMDFAKHTSQLLGELKGGVCSYTDLEVNFCSENKSPGNHSLLGVFCC